MNVVGSGGIRDRRRSHPPECGTVSIDDVRATPAELRSQLIPTLRRDAIAGAEPTDAWVARLVAECREGLAALLPLNDAEREFMDRLLDHGEVEPTLLTNDADLADRDPAAPRLGMEGAERPSV